MRIGHLKSALQIAALALATLTIAGAPLPAMAQSSGSITPEPPVKKTNRPSKVEVMGGHISDDGTFFVDDQDLKSWKIANQGAVKDFKSSDVRIDGVKDFKRGAITVRTIRSKNQEISSPGDARK